jgi:hypothetical protein
MKNNLLEVGDVLYDTDRWHGIMQTKVVSLTPKRAKLDTGAYVEKELVTIYATDGRLGAKRIGDYGYRELETEQWKRRYERQELAKKARRHIENLSIGTLSNEQLELILSIKSENKPENENP